MAFRAINFEEGKRVLVPAKASITFVKGNALKDDGAGFFTNSASGDNTDVWYVCDESVVSASTDGATYIHAIPTAGIRFEVDTSNTPTQTEAGLEVDLSAAGTVDSSAVTDQVFHVEQFKLPLSSKVAIGYFTRGVPNS
jgi:hypothetical protein